MCNASGQRADRFHFMGLSQLVFKMLAFRDVLMCDDHSETVGALKAGHTDDKPPCFVSAMTGVLENELVRVPHHHLANALHHRSRFLRTGTGDAATEREVVVTNAMRRPRQHVLLSKSVPRRIDAQNRSRVV